MMDFAQLSALLGVSCSQAAPLTGVCIDSRVVRPGNLFVAILGQSFDGHAFIPEAIAAGAVAILHSKPVVCSVPHVQVVDTVAALATIATHHRACLPCSVIAVTGSNGKTTVKEMIARILPQPALATQGNLNNHLGVPLSVLKLEPAHRYAVFELGANHPGEIARTVSIVQPQVALINNIAPAHIGEFGSIEAVVQAKGEIYQGLGVEGTAVVNEDDKYVSAWADLLKDKKTVGFSMQHATDVFATHVRLNENGCAQFRLVMPCGDAEIQLRVPGLHHVSNALAASACAWAVGLGLEAIVPVLQEFTGVPGRVAVLAGKNHATVIDDTYNANLQSVLAGLQVLAQYKGRRIFVFGDMGELGEWAQQHHQEVGVAARELGIERLMTYGVHSECAARSYGANAGHYTSHEALIQDLLPELQAGTTVLVKGSRSTAMEQVVKPLLAV